MPLLHFQKKKGWEPKETYRQIELAAMPMPELQKLSREEYEKAMECREAARKAGFIPPTWCRCGVDHMPAQSNSFTTSRAATVSVIAQHSSVQQSPFVAENSL